MDQRLDDDPCIQVWLPFANGCTDFITGQFPTLAPLTRRCNTANGNHALPPPPPTPAPGSGGGSEYYAQGSLAMTSANIGSSAKRQNRFKQNLREDIAAALDITPSAILIQDLSASSVTLDIFSDSQAHAQALIATIQSQLADPASALVTGSTSSALTPNQQPQMQVLALGATDASGGGFATGAPAVGTLKIRVDDQSTYYFNGGRDGFYSGFTVDRRRDIHLHRPLRGWSPTRLPHWQRQRFRCPRNRCRRRVRHHRLVGSLWPHGDHQHGLQVHQYRRLC